MVVIDFGQIFVASAVVLLVVLGVDLVRGIFQ